MLFIAVVFITFGSMGRHFLIDEFLKYVNVYFKHKVLRLLLRSNSTLTINICLITRKKPSMFPGIPPHLSHNCIFVSQLQDKFERLKRIQQEETIKLEEEKRKLDEEIMNFYKMKADSEISQTQSCANIKKDKDRKK